MPKRIDPQDIVGKKFGRLTVESYAGAKRNPDGTIRDRLYQCRCECGNTKIIRRGHLISGNTKSCGCLQKEQVSSSSHRHVIRIDTEDLIGKKFGKLTVEKYLGRKPKGSGRLHHIYQCRCECGNICEAIRQTLLGGEKTSCGCAFKETLFQMDVNDIVGKKFGKLTVLEYAGISGNKKGINRHEYLCRCECGKEKLISRSNLLSGGVNSCGCSKTIDPEDLIGKRYGKLTVIEYLGRDEYDPRHPHMYRCKCDCGNECIERRDNLRQEHVLSCGCRAKETPHPWVKNIRIDPQDIVGTRVGRLTVMEYLGRPEGSPYRDHFYRCKCDCGNEVTVRRNSLTSKATRSCGCLKRESNRENGRKRKGKKKAVPVPQGPLPFPDDIIGEVEGRFTCIKRLYQRKDRNWMYLVRCECGHEFELDRGNFLLQSATCPGCHKSARPFVQNSSTLDVNDIIGNRYGRLTVLEYAGRDDIKRCHLYLCQCDCGNTKIIQRGSLIGGKTNSCGCLAKEINSLPNDKRAEYLEGGYHCGS